MFTARSILVTVSILIVFTIPAFGFEEGQGSPPSPIDVPRDPTITITFSQPQYSVNVEPGETGVVHTDVTVRCEMPPSTPPGQYCIVNLQAEAGGWPVNVPPSLTFSNTDTEEKVMISTQIPVETSSRVNGQLTVSGRWSYSPGTRGGTVDPSSAQIVVLPYGKPVVGIDNENLTGKVGSWHEIELTVRNDGNCEDTISFEVLEKPGNFDAYFPDTSVTVGEKEETTVLLMMKQRTGSPGSTRIIISASSSNPGKNANITKDIIYESKLSLNSFFTSPITIGALVILLIIGIVVSAIVARKMGRKFPSFRRMEPVVEISGITQTS